MSLTDPLHDQPAISYDPAQPLHDQRASGPAMSASHERPACCPAMSASHERPACCPAMSASHERPACCPAIPPWVVLFVIIAAIVIAWLLIRGPIHAGADMVRGWFGGSASWFGGSASRFGGSASRFGGSASWFGGGDDNSHSRDAALAALRMHELGEVKDLRKHPRSRSEAEVIRHLEQLTGTKFPTVNPPWLTWCGKTLELDGFNGRIALEFSGPLHTKWTPSFEPYTSYFKRIVKDVVKVRTCKRLGVPLIVIDASLPSRHWRAYLESRLADLGIGERNPNYIAKQVAEPWRNDSLEAELGLANEMLAAKAI